MDRLGVQKRIYGNERGAVFEKELLGPKRQILLLNDHSKENDSPQLG